MPTWVRLAATALIIGPLAWAAALLTQDLHARPTGRSPAVVQNTPDSFTLSPGRTFRVELEPSAFPYRELRLVTPQAGPARTARLEVCAAAICTAHQVRLVRYEPASLPLPSDFRGGGVSITPLAVEGAIVLGSFEGAPAVQAVRGFSWSLPIARAAEICRAMTGANVFIPLLALNAVVLAALIVLAITFAWRRSASDEDQARGASLPSP